MNLVVSQERRREKEEEKEKEKDNCNCNSYILVVRDQHRASHMSVM